MSRLIRYIHNLCVILGALIFLAGLGSWWAPWTIGYYRDKPGWSGRKYVRIEEGVVVLVVAGESHMRAPFDPREDTEFGAIRLRVEMNPGDRAHPMDIVGYTMPVFFRIDSVSAYSAVMSPPIGWKIGTNFVVLSIVLLAFPIARRRWVRQRMARAIAENRCPDCGYDLRATPQRCPECGRATPAGEMLARLTSPM